LEITMLSRQQLSRRQLSRRQFINLGAGAAVTAALAACSSKGNSSTPAQRTPVPPDSTNPASTNTATTTPGSTVASTTPDPTLSSPPLVSSGQPTTTVSTVLSPTTDPGRTLVIVQMNGGNDALNTLVPSDGRYRDARPTLAIPESDLIALTGVSDWSLHPQLAPLSPYWDTGTASFLPGIGFGDPDHSHFVSLDRWWRADDLSSSTGWLGRSVADGALSPLYATALGSGAPLLRSDAFQAAVVIQAASFAFPAGLSEDVLRGLSAPVSADDLHALAQRSMASTIDAVDAFASLLDTTAGDSGDDVSYREGGLDLIQGLDLAARLVTSNVGARIVVVSVGGFDTHSNQLTTQAALLGDLATGIDAFMRAVSEAAMLDKTLLVTTSEFGRRVGENASGGFDHGAGGMSMMFGGAVDGGIHGEIDLGNQLDGDVRPTLDPRTMYTACLDWLGLDPVAALGKRFDEVKLLRV
jgi:uncharacterized protein (DUF1501 family)